MAGDGAAAAGVEGGGMVKGKEPHHCSEGWVLCAMPVNAIENRVDSWTKIVNAACVQTIATRAAEHG